LLLRHMVTEPTAMVSLCAAARRGRNGSELCTSREFL